MATLNQRLDSLPFTRKHSRLLAGSGLGWALDAMDVGLISFIMAALVAHWGLSATEISWLGSIGFVGMALGATLGGLLADRLGRRQVFALTLLVYGLATGASSLSTSLAMLLVFRFIVGLGLGAELPVASTLVSEFSPARIRGRTVVILEAFWAVGWLLAAIIGATVVAGSEQGWRWALALGLVPALYAAVIRWGLPESVRFLQGKGKQQEAERIVKEFEASPALFASRGAAKPQQQTAPAAASLEEGRQNLFSPAYRRRTLALWTIWFCINFAYYGAFIWIPSLLLSSGFSLVQSFTFTLVMTCAQLPGYAVSAWLVEVWGRRRTLAVFLFGSAASAVFYGLADSEPLIITAGCLLSFFNLGAWGALYALTPELYPTAVRASGAGAAMGFGRIASILAPLAVPPLVAAGGIYLLFILFALVFCLAAAASFALPEKRGVSLAA